MSKNRRVSTQPRADQQSSKGVPQAATTPLVPQPWWPWIGLALALVFTGAVSWRLLDVPLDRDEGEFACIAQQMLRGVPPYRSGYAMKMPGIYAAYALTMICCGESTRGIHAGVAIVNLVSITLVFLIAQRMYGSWVAVAAAALLSLLVLDATVNGIAAQAEPFVLLPALVGLWVIQLVYERASRHDLAAPRPAPLGLLVAGICFGMPLVIKQHGFSFSLFAAWYVLYQWWISPSRSGMTLLRSWGALAIGGVIPLATVVLLMKWSGAFDQFWFWTITYARAYANQIPPMEGASNLATSLGKFASSMPLLWAAAAMGISALWWDDKARSHRAVMLAFLWFSLLGTFPGFYFREHYFVFILPAVAMFAALGCQAVARLAQLIVVPKTTVRWPIATLLAAGIVVVIGAISHRDYLFFKTPLQICRQLYEGNPFPEAIEIARYISEHSTEAGPIMVLGSEPEIYFYTGRRAASPHIYMYPLMEEHPFALQMQQEMAAEVERVQPEWIVWESANAAWLVRPNSEGWIFGWMPSLLDRHYKRVGVIEILGPSRTTYLWNEEAATFQPKSSNSLAVFRRKKPLAASGAMPVEPQSVGATRGPMIEKTAPRP